MTQQYRCIYEIRFVYPASTRVMLKRFLTDKSASMLSISQEAVKRMHYESNSIPDIWAHCQGTFKDIDDTVVFHNIISIEKIEVPDDKY